MMRNKEMSMNDYREMYKECCIEENATMTPEGFMSFVAWRKNVEKHFDQWVIENNNEEAS